MANKRNAIVLLLSLIVPLALSADWRSDLAGFLLSGKDVMAAQKYLLEHIGEIEDADRPTACGLLAYLSQRVNDPANERKWIEVYFETYRAPDVALSFLDVPTESDVLLYLAGWKAKYPLVTDVAFINRERPEDYSSLGMEIGVELDSQALFKFSDEKGVIRGGMFHEGLNIIGLSDSRLFEQAGSHRYKLELKVGDTLVKREIQLTVQLEGENPFPQVGSKPGESRTREYTVSMYVGDRLILSSKKYSLEDRPLQVDIKAGGIPPLFIPPFDRPDFTSSQVSILDAAALAYKLISDLLKKKKEKEEPYVPGYKKVQEITKVLVQRDSQGMGRVVRARVMLSSRNLGL